MIPWLISLHHPLSWLSLKFITSVCVSVCVPSSLPAFWYGVEWQLMVEYHICKINIQKITRRIAFSGFQFLGLLLFFCDCWFLFFFFFPLWVPLDYEQFVIKTCCLLMFFDDDDNDNNVDYNKDDHKFHHKDFCQDKQKINNISKNFFFHWWRAPF